MKFSRNFTDVNHKMSILCIQEDICAVEQSHGWTEQKILQFMGKLGGLVLTDAYLVSTGNVFHFKLKGMLSNVLYRLSGVVFHICIFVVKTGQCGLRINL